jgi:hypothetical protein
MVISPLLVLDTPCAADPPVTLPVIFTAPFEVLFTPLLPPPDPPTTLPIILTTPLALLVSNGVDPPPPVAVQFPVIVSVPLEAFAKARPVFVPAEVTSKVPELLLATPTAVEPPPVTVPTIVAVFGETPAKDTQFAEALAVIGDVIVTPLLSGNVPPNAAVPPPTNVPALAALVTNATSTFISTVTVKVFEYML